jgi:arylsulfatase A-like enzyme
MQGKSLWPSLRGGAGDWRDEIFIQISEAQHARALRTRRWKYCVAAPPEAAASHAAFWPTYTEQALYDLERDPHELTNLVNRMSHAGVAAELRARLRARMLEAGEPPAVIEPAAQRLAI